MPEDHNLEYSQRYVKGTFKEGSCCCHNTTPSKWHWSQHTLKFPWKFLSLEVLKRRTFLEKSLKIEDKIRLFV